MSEVIFTKTECVLDVKTVTKITRVGNCDIQHYCYTDSYGDTIFIDCTKKVGEKYVSVRIRDNSLVKHLSSFGLLDQLPQIIALHFDDLLEKSLSGIYLIDPITYQPEECGFVKGDMCGHLECIGFSGNHIIRVSPKHIDELINSLNFIKRVKRA